MKYKVLDMNNIDKMVEEFLEDFAENFDYESSKKMIFESKDKFIKWIKPILINDFEHDINDNPEILENFENKGNGVYVSDTGVEVTLQKE